MEKSLWFKHPVINIELLTKKHARQNQIGLMQGHCNSIYKNERNDCSLFWGVFCRHRLKSGTMQTLPYTTSSIKPSGRKYQIRIKASIKKSKNYVEKSGILKRSVFIRYKQTTTREKWRLNFTLTYLQTLTNTCVRKWLWKRRTT